MHLFGYVKIDKPNLLVKEYDTYKSIYCSLCKELGKSYGIVSRFTLSYDFVFLSLVYMNSSNLCPTFKKGRCSFNPLHKCGKVCTKDGSIQFSSAAAMIMQYFKLKDNIADSNLLKKMVYYPLLPIFSAAKNKAKKQYPKLYEISHIAFINQEKVEKSSNCSIDESCEPTAKSLSEIFELISDDQKQKRILSRLGYCVGKWIYLIDALDDLQEDEKHHRFNPFLVNNTSESLNQIITDAQQLMNVCICEACNVFELCDNVNFSGIIKNILYKGMPNVQDEIIKKLSEGKNK